MALFGRSRPCMITGVPVSSTIMLGTDRGSQAMLLGARRCLFSPESPKNEDEAKSENL